MSTFRRLQWLVRLLGRKPRIFGCIVASILLALLLMQAGYGLIAAIVISFSWLLGIVIGGKWPLITVLFWGGRQEKSAILTWGRALWFSLFCTLLAGRLVDDQHSIRLLLGIVSLPLAVCYVFGKLGCYVFGCCDWHERAHKWRTRPLSLPLCEVMLQTLFAIPLICLYLQNGRSVAAIFVFAVGHGTVRTLCIVGQGRERGFFRSTLRWDGGLIAYVAFILWCLKQC